MNENIIARRLCDEAICDCHNRLVEGETASLVKALALSDRCAYCHNRFNDPKNVSSSGVSPVFDPESKLSAGKMLAYNTQPGHRRATASTPKVSPTGC
jgi:hypothetical protein